MDVTSYMLGKKNGGITPTGTISITENGEHNVTSYATANVSVEPDLESKSVTITENTTTTITPTSGKDGLSSVSVTTNVSGGTDTRWQQIGYEEEPASIQDGIDYAKQIMQNWDLTITVRNKQFNSDNKLVYFPSVDTSDTTNTKFMFLNAINLKYVPDLDLTSCTDAATMFSGCTSIEEIGELKFNGYVIVQNMFINLSSLKKLKSLYITANMTSGDPGLKNCPELETIDKIESNNLTSYTKGVATNCPKLSNATLKKILNFAKTLTNQQSGYKTLLNLGLSETQATLCTTFNEWTELANAGWTTGY